jgi:hypothetical protein
MRQGPVVNESERKLVLEGGPSWMALVASDGKGKSFVFAKQVQESRIGDRDLRRNGPVNPG